LRENALELYLDNRKVNNNSPLEELEKYESKRKIMDLSYNFICDFHSEIQSVLISVIEHKKLLTPFYLEIFK
jgi:hypothetical protein